MECKCLCGKVGGFLELNEILWIFSGGMRYVILGVCFVGSSTFQTSVLGLMSRLTE